MRLNVVPWILRACAILVPLLCGCGIRSSLTDDVGERVLAPEAGTPTPMDAASAAPDAAASDGAVVDSSDAGSDVGLGVDADEPDVALPATNLGDVFLVSGSYVNGTFPTLIAKAEFFPTVSPTGCVVSEVAGCTLETCDALEGGSTYQSASAGPTVAVTGGAYTLLLARSGSGPYGPIADDGGVMTLWHGGDALTVSAPGDVVPAFTATLIAPTQVTVLTPPPPVLSKSGAFAFSWLGQSAGSLTVDVNARSGGTDFYLECQYTVASGVGVVPQVALQRMPAGSASLTVSTVNRTEVTVSGWVLRAFAQTNANDSSDVEYQASLQIQ